MDDLVCEECGWTPVMRRIETTTFDDTSRTFMTIPARCSNPSCENVDGGTFDGFAVTRAEYLAAHGL